MRFSRGCGPQGASADSFTLPTNRSPTYVQRWRDFKKADLTLGIHGGRATSKLQSADKPVADSGDRTKARSQPVRLDMPSPILRPGNAYRDGHWRSITSQESDKRWSVDSSFTADGIRGGRRTERQLEIATLPSTTHAEHVSTEQAQAWQPMIEPSAAKMHVGRESSGTSVWEMTPQPNRLCIELVVPVPRPWCNTTQLT
jgi:hypothetical protein